MQKVLRRTALAKGQAKRKAAIVEDKETIRDRAQLRERTVQLRREHLDAVKAERIVRRQKWELGPLSPHHSDINTMSQHYGTWSIEQVMVPAVPKKLRVKDWFVREGDRVCVVEGGYGLKGRIGKIIEVDKESDAVKVEGLNVKEVMSPPSMNFAGDGARLLAVECPIPLKNVRLVYPLPDPQTGIPRDCILTSLAKRDAFYDRYNNKMEWSRVLKPQNIRIPWPEEEEPEHRTYEIDTPRLHVESKSFMPTLLGPPMPGGIIDELRNKYSVFRDRHEDEYLATKQAEDQAEALRKQQSKALRPRGARNIARDAPAFGQRSSTGRNVLTDEAAEKVGAAIRAAQAARRN